MKMRRDFASQREQKHLSYVSLSMVDCVFYLIFEVLSLLLFCFVVRLWLCLYRLMREKRYL